MNNLDIGYQGLLQQIIEQGIEKETRNGKTRSIFGVQMKHRMETGFPILTSKKVAFKTAMTELRWFLNGDTNIKYLVDNNCHIWNGDAFKYYKNNFNLPSAAKEKMFNMDTYIELIKTNKEFAEEWGELGPIYGKQWIKWQGWVQYQKEDGSLGCGSLWYNQIARLILNLKKNPDSRRLLVSAWNPAELSEMTVPPCHYSFQVYTREISGLERWTLCNNEIDVEDPNLNSKLDELDIPTRKISLMWNQRSADVPLGLPFNFVSYGALLHMIANEVNMIPDELIVNIGDAHIYENQLELAKEQVNRSSHPLPMLELEKGIDAEPEDFKLINYIHEPSIKYPLSN